jgi:hypothetical protein
MSSYYFIQDQRNNVNHLNYYYFASAFTPSELIKIRQIGDNLPKQRALVGGGDTNEVTDYRKSEISWIPDNQDTEWLYSKIADYAKYGDDVDTISQKIGLFNYINDDFKWISTSFAGNFKHYESDFNNFQWIDAELNWYTCNLFGEIKLIRQVPDFNTIQIINSNLILYSKGEHLYFLDFKSNKTQEVQNVDKSFEYFIYKDQILSIFTNRQIKNYKIIIP